MTCLASEQSKSTVPTSHALVELRQGASLLSEVARAASIRDRLPSMGFSPELWSDARPAFVVLFKDGFVPPPMAGIGEPPGMLDRAVCVVQGDGTVNLYSNVSREGFSAEE